MSIAHIGFDAITAADLQRLVDNGVPESLTLDYKRDLPNTSDKQILAFLADVTAFANRSGGDLIYGISDRDGAPGTLCGVDNIEREDEYLRSWQSRLNDNVDPRIFGIRLRWIPLPDERRALLIRVPPSLDAPHMVKRDQKREFYLRHERGNSPMSTHEIRTTVIRTADWHTRAEAWRRERVDVVDNNGGPLVLAEGAKLVLHFVPMQPCHLDFSDTRLINLLRSIGPKASQGWNHAYTFEGFSTSHFTDETLGYRLWFADGRLELVDPLLSRDVHGDSPSNPVRLEQLEESIIEFLGVPHERNAAHIISTPGLLFASVVGTLGRSLCWIPQLHGIRSGIARSFNNDQYLAPPVLVQADDNLSLRLLPTINRFWQAAGLPRSPNFDAQGRRLRR